MLLDKKSVIAGLTIPWLLWKVTVKKQKKCVLAFQENVYFDLQNESTPLLFVPLDCV